MSRAAPPAVFRAPAVEARARALYREDLPYHNFGHAEETVASGRHIVERCREEGIRIDPMVVYYALLFHDAGYAEDHIALGFPSKEAYSARLATDILSEHGVQGRIIDKVTRAILSTHRNAQFLSAEDKAVRAADLAGLAADWDVFRGNTVHLWEEHRLLQLQDITWRAWLPQAIEVIAFYLAQEIRLTSYFSAPNGVSVFHSRAGTNLERLRAELRTLEASH